MIHITAHAIQRYQERVANVSDDEARRRIDTVALRSAVQFGAPYVRLATGQRLVIQHGAVVTVLPSEHGRGGMGRDSDRRRLAEVGGGSH